MSTPEIVRGHERNVVVVVGPEDSLSGKNYGNAIRSYIAMSRARDRLVVVATRRIVLRDFKPLINKETTDSATIEATFKRGDVAEGLQACKKTGRSLVEFASAIAVGMKKLYVSGRSNELLSLIYKHGLPCPYDIPSLLRALLKKNDFPGFLKECCDLRSIRDSRQISNLQLSR